MTLSMIAACDRNRAIGYEGDIPWDIPDDLQFFKTMTIGKTLVMGRKTFESLGNRPLPNRKTIVLTSNTEQLHPNIQQVNSIDPILELAKTNTDVMICGGGQVYLTFLPYCEIVYLTEIDLDVGGDTFFPKFEDDNWKRVGNWKKEQSCEDGSSISYTIRTYLKK
tara:strand:+ start:350 stop:844 length:495 start_codon:yes stop_codon:yes gene_type:complete